MALSKRRKTLADLKSKITRLRKIESRKTEGSMYGEHVEEIQKQKEAEDNGVSSIQNKKDRKKLMRKIERKGLSQNAIKSQLRPCLVSGNAIEEREDNKVEVNSGDLMMKRKAHIPKVCKLCGKKILGDILEHFREKHFNFYVANYYCPLKIEMCAIMCPQCP